MVKGHSNNKGGNSLLPYYGILFQISSILQIIAHVTAFVTPVVDHWLEPSVHKHENKYNQQPQTEWVLKLSVNKHFTKLYLDHQTGRTQIYWKMAPCS